MKKCSYYGCGSFVLNGAPQGNYKLFSVPRDMEIRKQWLNLGNVQITDPNEKIYFCSNHFDAKYVNWSAKRKLLVRDALPQRFTFNIKSNGNASPNAPRSSLWNDGDPTGVGANSALPVGNRSNSPTDPRHYEETMKPDPVSNAENNVVVVKMEYENESDQLKEDLNRYKEFAAKVKSLVNGL